MAKSLVIVESPAKAKTINKYLGKDFVVKSSVGHVRDLPTSSKGKKASPAKTAAQLKAMSAEEKAAYKQKRDQDALFSRMGINPEKDWKAKYEVLPGKEKVVKELKTLAANAEQIYLATDLDREGEAIAWHLREIIGGDDSKYQRVVFNEITKNAIQDAFSHPDRLNIERVNAQQARRFLDRVVGFMVSPLLWKKIARGLSAGRVQSVAVRLVVEREREIKAFVPQEFWQIHADLKAGAEPLHMEVVKYHGETLKISDETTAMQAVDYLKSAQYVVSNQESKATQSRPGAPFITSTMQQAASTRLGFGVKKTMMMAQRLYEAGHITYMRTDSTSLSKDAVEGCRDYIQDNFGDKYLPAKPVTYGNKANAQEAHEAIRPSNVNALSGHLNDMEADAKKLYELIWRQFVACQMPAAKYDSQTITVKAGNYDLKAKGRVLIFDGWTKVQPVSRKKGDDDQSLPALALQQSLDLQKLDPSQHFTKPTARFSEASLVKELEKRGIGRPSTYAAIISTIQDRGYVRLENRRFYAEKMGEIVNDRLVDNFVDLMSFDFTANMESKLDDIADGQLAWKDVLNEFYDDFKSRLHTAELPDAEGGMRANQMVLTDDIACPTCDRRMGIRTASTGVFLGCEGYNLPPKERCTKTLNLTPGEEAISADNEEAETDALRAKERCQKCGTAMDSYLIDEERKLHVCGNNPSCDGHKVETGKFKIKGYDGPLIECDKCGSDMQLKNGRFGKYFGCTSEDCKNTRKLLRSGEAAPPKADPIPMPELKCLKVDDHYILRDGASGIFLAASQFPKNRETRAPLVEELLTVGDKLDPKYKFLLSAPTEDPDGNKAIVRFSRKAKQQYVMTEVNAKATGWTATYDKGVWTEKAKAKRAPAKKK